MFGAVIICNGDSMKSTQLNLLPLGRTAKIVCVDCNNKLKSRLSDLGLYEGNDICPVLKSPLGEPRAYRINEATVALRDADCKKITVIFGD